ncbi:hypothetical protein G9A89_006727 [Geosiphon pyriformis]|nr:hypothetical protein G9A89_006727 [Geosiphon pyriformis]
MLAGSTSRRSLGLHMYMMKAVHQWLLVVIKKKLYDKRYPDMLCLLCGGVELPDHAFTCALNGGIREKILAEASAS